jgi:phosphomannomutase/phosphoglucomutase
VAKNLAALQDEVRERGAELGIAFDGDGDRVAFVDETGAIAPIDKCIVLFARERLSRGPGKVVYDIKCSSIVPEEVARCGGTPMISKSGHAFIKRTLILDQAVLGGEISGHYFFNEIRGDDGLYAALELSWLVATSGRSLSGLLAEIPTYAITPDLRIPYPREAQQPVLDAVEAYHSRREAGETGATGWAREVGKLDGVRVTFPQGWGLIRRSVTEPLLTFRFEGRTPDGLRQVMAEFLAPIPEVAPLVGTALAIAASDFVAIE